MLNTLSISGSVSTILVSVESIPVCPSTSERDHPAASALDIVYQSGLRTRLFLHKFTFSFRDLGRGTLALFGHRSSQRRDLRDVQENRRGGEGRLLRSS